MDIFESAFIEKLRGVYSINPETYEKYDVKRGLRNKDGTGVLVGLTSIGDVRGYIIEEKDKINVPGKLTYRGVDMVDIVRENEKRGRHAFEETMYLILMGELPTDEELNDDYIIPPVFDKRVSAVVAEAVKKCAFEQGITR